MNKANYSNNVQSKNDIGTSFNQKEKERKNSLNLFNDKVHHIENNKSGLYNK